MKEWLLWTVLAVLVFLAAIFVWQERLLYFPMRTTVERMEGGPLRAWPSAQDFRGLVAEPQGEARATAIVFHGNAGHAGHRAYYALALAPLGLRVILAEYPATDRAWARGESRAWWPTPNGRWRWRMNDTAHRCC
jgi:hypothetical protein